MLRRCVMSQVRRLTTASSREYQKTNLKTYLNHTPPQPYRSHMISPPFNQLLVFRSLSTATPPNHEDAKGSEITFHKWMKSIYDNRLMALIGALVTLKFAFMFGKMMKKMYDDKKNVKKAEKIRDGYLKYHITGFMGVLEDTISVEIRNSQVLIVSGLTLKSNAKPVVIERHITIPNRDYSEAKKKATFHSDVGLLVVEISDFKKPQDIKIEIEETN